ncbi:arginase family protein [Dactylosporangium sp. CS-033363]|uniref:arginase family protein n=1 Tax=Dactylosporangium sp. CS-033363 TaxID=3239935 RepID=UPI003D919473
MPELELIAAPWCIGLRPGRGGVEPGTWRAPSVLLEAGLAARLGAAVVTELPRPPYDPEPQPGTRIRNGLTIREHALLLAAAVEAALGAARVPLVLGGDCSVLLGGLAGARRRGTTGLVHIDGHTDFKHPGNADFTELGNAVGMDLALATGRGELLLTDWPGPLVADRDAVQLGDRTGRPIEPLVVGIAELLAGGMAAAAERAARHLEPPPIWVHVDLDVLDGAVLPAVDTPGSPGLTFAQLTELLGALWRTGRVAGLDVAVYDPDLDPELAHAPSIVGCLAEALV